MSVIPDESDPRWRDLVAGRERLRLESLAARMLMTRLRLKTMKGDEQSIRDAVGVAHAFFSRNLHSASADLDAIFGILE